MGGVASGSPVSASNTNSAFIDSNGDDVTIGRLGLQNTLAESGANVDNIQKEHNSVSSYTGKPLNSNKDILPSWNNASVGTPSDNLLQRSEALTEKFDNSSGHKHTGAIGDAPPIDSTDLANVVLHGYFKAGSNITGVTGSSTDVSSLMIGLTASSNQTTKGVVVNAPYNRVFIFDGDGHEIVTPLGDTVYGRLTFSASVWTLSYYSLVGTTETAYSFATSTLLRWQYQQLYNPITDAPVYSELTSVPSDNATSDVVYATESLAGKVLLSSVVAQPVGSTNVKGTGVAVSHEDHVHQGVHSVFKTGDSQIYGDVELSTDSTITITRSGNKFTFASVGGTIGYQEVPGGPVNGTNTTFGPLSQTPASNQSIVVFVDGIALPKTAWSLSGLSIVLTTAPQLGQSIYVFFLASGTPITPPAPSGVWRTEYRTLTAGEVSAKIVTLAYTPANPAYVMVDIIGGTSQEFNVDYTVVSNEFRWNGYGLDGVLSSGDKIRFGYIT